MTIIETCPKCGHDLHDVVLTVNPPIPKKECWNCGWSWVGAQEGVMRVPFGGNSLTVDNATIDLLNSYHDYNLEHSLSNNFDQSICTNCPNNPENGGSGICHCTLGQIHFC